MENKIVGQLLKEARESKKLSIEDVAKKTKINLNLLKHLEANRLDKLPNITYVRGFVKNYSKLVGVNQQVALESLKFTYGESAEEQPVPTTEETNNIEEKQRRDENTELQDNIKSIVSSFINKKALYGIAALVVLIIVGKSIGAFFTQLSDEQVKIVKEEQPINTESDSVDNEATDQDSQLGDEDIARIEVEKELLIDEKVNKEAQAKARAEQEKQRLLDEEEKKLNELEEQRIAQVEAAKKKAKEELKTQKLDGKYPKVNFYPAPKDMYTIVADSDEAKDEEIFPTRFKKAMEDGTENVYIKAQDGDSWVSYQSDEDDIKRFVLKQGRSVIIKGQKILLFMGNVTASKIFYNGKLLEVKTTSGVKSMIFPERLAADYQLPLFPSYKGIPIKADVYKANMATE
jgi:cytoskeletal protein RodZ